MFSKILNERSSTVATNQAQDFHMYLPEVTAEVDAECRRRSIRMLGAQKASRLTELILEARPKLVVEVGTAIGYSGLWIPIPSDNWGRAAC
jgi:predicted O-methyltransferase YrrM